MRHYALVQDACFKCLLQRIFQYVWKIALLNARFMYMQVLAQRYFFIRIYC